MLYDNMTGPFDEVYRRSTIYRQIFNSDIPSREYQSTYYMCICTDVYIPCTELKRTDPWSLSLGAKLCSTHFSISTLKKLIQGLLVMASSTMGGACFVSMQIVQSLQPIKRQCFQGLSFISIYQKKRFVKPQCAEFSLWVIWCSSNIVPSALRAFKTFDTWWEIVLGNATHLWCCLYDSGGGVCKPPPPPPLFVWI